MSRGVHAVQHEVEHKIKHDDGHHGLGDVSSTNKKMALIIAVLALLLSFSEAAGKSAQTTELNAQMEASNLWSFYQAKNTTATRCWPSTTITNSPPPLSKSALCWPRLR
jgi:hypothetical protein